MNKAMKQQLETLITSLINEDTESSTEAIREYLCAKSQQIILGEKEDDKEMDDDEDVEFEVDDEVDDEDKDEDKDEDEDEDEDEHEDEDEDKK